MIKRTLMAAILALGFAAPAMAFHCPADMAKIDKALPQADLSESDTAKVMSLRAEGEKLHNAGDHAKAVEVLGEALKMLNVQ